MEQTTYQSLLQKLDLDGYETHFRKLLAREKPFTMEGDINQHFRFIEALSKVKFPTPPQIPLLDETLQRISKQAVLTREEIYTFVEILGYFNRLSSVGFTEPLISWLEKIEIPQEIVQVIHYFNDEGEINPQIDETLLSLEESLKRNKQAIKESLYSLTSSQKLQPYLIDTQIHFHGGEESLLVRGGFNHAVKATVVARSAGGHFYIVPQSLTKLKEKESTLLSQKEEILYGYYKEISTLFFTWYRFLLFINKEFDKFDHYQARVSLARAKNYEFVLPNKEKCISLEAFAHPALQNPVPVTLHFDKKIMLITGVNAGGKTMLLKSLLAAVFMSKHLLPFRCNVAKTTIGRYKFIDAIIDDPQSVKNDISTFAGRIQQFATLFHKQEALIGVDEIELGTDSDEAATLFRILLEKLKHKEVYFIVTTHHKRLASLMAKDDDVALVAALYDEKKELPTYTFLQGSIGKSYAFETAKRYGIPATIIEEAKICYGEDKENLNELIEKSTNLERELRLKLKKVDAELTSLEKKKSHLEEEEFKLQEAYRKEVTTLENRYNAATNKAREALKAKESTEGRRLLNRAHQFKESVKKEEKPQKEPLKEGDRVKYRSHKGEVIAIRGNDATILVDGLKMRVPLSQLKKHQNQMVKPQPQPPQTTVKVEKSQATVSVKLLGMYADEAIEKVDKVISDALVNNLNEIEIIHGLGSGALAKVIWEYLKKHPKIGNFYKMPGNLGITVIEL
jgi:DNA mismatch repair protein MutS2